MLALFSWAGKLSTDLMVCPLPNPNINPLEED